MNEFFAPPGHFYSPIVDREEASAALQRSVLSNIIYGIDLNDQKQSELINTLSPYFKNIEISDNKEGEKRYYFINDQYSFGDALIYQAMLRHFKPKRLIEIGSGYSSALALDTRDQHGSPTHLTFIEPSYARSRV